MGTVFPSPIGPPHKFSDARRHWPSLGFTRRHGKSASHPDEADQTGGAPGTRARANRRAGKPALVSLRQTPLPSSSGSKGKPYPYGSSDINPLFQIQYKSDRVSWSCECIGISRTLILRIAGSEPPLRPGFYAGPRLVEAF